MKQFIAFLQKYSALLVFVLIGVVIIYILIERSRINALKSQLAAANKETQIVQNNYYASQDSIKQYKTKYGAEVGTVSGYQITISELKGQYKNLFSQYTQLETQPPKTIIEYKTIIKDSIINAKISIVGHVIGIKGDTVFDSSNYRNLTGSMDYNIDTNKKLTITASQFEIIQGMAVITGLSIDTKNSNRPVIWVQTSYPGVTFTKIVGADVMADSKSKDAIQAMRKNWGIGFFFGYGMALNGSQIIACPQIGIGLHYTPKWLQF